MFGPLLAMQAGHNHTVHLQNKLTAPVNDHLVRSANHAAETLALSICVHGCPNL